MQTDVQTPWGETVTVEHPEGASDEDILNYAQQQHQQQQPQAQAAPKTFWQKLMTETWPARMAQGLYSGATYPGDVWQGKAQLDPTDPTSISLGRVLNLSAFAPVSTLPTVAASAPTVKQLISEGVSQRNEAINSGLMFSPNKVQEGIDTIRSQLPHPEDAVKTHNALDRLQTKVDSGQPMTIEDLHLARKDMKTVQFNAAKSTGETAATDLMASTTAKHGIDDIMRGTPEGDQYITGNQNIAAGKMAESLDKKTWKAGLQTASTYSGQNVGNKIRQTVTGWLTGKEGRTIPDYAKQQAQQLIEGTTPENQMRLWSNRLGGGQGLGYSLGSIGGGLLGYAASGGEPSIAAGAAMVYPAIGSLLKTGANTLAMNHLAALSQALRANTPLGQIVKQGANEAINPNYAAYIRALVANAGELFPTKERRYQSGGPSQ